MVNPTPALELLGSDGPHPKADKRLMQFGRLVGSWMLTVSFFDEDGSGEETTAEWHWAWILGGRAIQDVLVFPARSSGQPADDYRVGTSLRLFDESAEMWKVVWVAPQSGTIYKLSGSFSGDGGVVLTGDPQDGEPTRWVFSNVSDDRFRWDGFVKEEPGGEWRLIQRMAAQRTA